MLETLAALIERDWRVVLALPCEGPLAGEARRLGAEVVVLAAPVLRREVLRPASLVRFLGASLRSWWQIGRLLASERPSAVYVPTLRLPLWIARARAAQVPIIAHLHGGECRAPRLVRTALATPLLLADRVLVDSAFNRDALLDGMPRLRARSAVLHGGIAGPASATPARAVLHDELHVVYVGEVSRRHGVDVAVDAIGRLVERGIDATLDVVGSVSPDDRWFEEQLRQSAASLRITERVLFDGFQPEVWGPLADADVAVVPARLGQPAGDSAVEAVVAARPVVVSASGDHAEAVDGFMSALSVPASDAAALADALQRIAANWSAFRRTAAAFAPIAAQRYSETAYRSDVAEEIARAARTRLPRSAS